MGADIIGDHPSPLLRLARQIAMTHHEKWDGTGYPKGLKQEKIPVSGRIVAIADVFDALTTQRPYKEAWPLEKAVDLLKKEAGRHFDPDLVPVFLNAIDEVRTIKERFSEDTLDKDFPGSVPL